MSDEREPPDHDEDPRGQDVGQGYPETQPAGAQPPGADGGRAADRDAEHEGPPGPERERERSRTTGNPGLRGDARAVATGVHEGVPRSPAT